MPRKPLKDGNHDSRLLGLEGQELFVLCLIRVVFHQAASAALITGVRKVQCPPLRLGCAQCCGRFACHGGVMAGSSFLIACCLAVGTGRRAHVDVVDVG